MGHKQIDKFPKRGKHQLRKGRYSISGSYYYLTITTFDRLNLLCCKGVPEILFDSLNFLDERNSLKTVCCIVMPDHIHVVAKLPKNNKLSDVLKSFKGFTSHKINKLLGRKGSFWQEQYYEHRVRDDEDLERIAEYCHENPLRAGLTEKPGEWEYWYFREENLC